MMSKNSFLANMRENGKRRNWIILIYSVVFLLIYPIGLLLVMTSERGYYSPAEWKLVAEITASQYLTVNPLMIIVVTMLAILCGIQGYSYLFKRQKLDMYMSVPVSKEHRFFVIYLNGILSFVIPYAVSLIITLPICATNGVLTGTVVKTMIFGYLAHTVYYFAVYNIAILAVMLTGTLLVSLLATAVLAFYEYALRLLLAGFCYTFLRTYSSYNTFKAGFSPVIMFFEAWINYESSIPWGMNEPAAIPMLLEVYGIVFLKILLVGAITGVLAYFAYTKRPAESCNKSIAFAKAKPVIKVAILVLLSTLVGTLFFSMTDENLGMALFGFVIGVVLSHCLIEVIFEYDLKAILKGWKSTLVGAAVVVVAFLVFKFDLIGYNKWVPDADKVESVAVAIPAFEHNGSSYDFHTGNWQSATEYSMKNMEFTDVETVCAFMEKAMQEDVEMEEKIISVFVKYNMKNGDEKYRQVTIPYEKYLTELDTIVSSEQYQIGINQMYDEEVQENMSLEEVYVSNGVTGKEVEKADFEAIMEAYKKDMTKLSATKFTTQYPIAVIDFNYEQKERDYRYYGMSEWGFSVPVYADFENTIAYLEQNDLLSDWYEDIDAISMISIEKWNAMYGGTEERTFTEKEQIEELLPALMPNQLHYYYCDYYLLSRSEEDPNVSYEAWVTFDFEGVDEDTCVNFAVNVSMLPDYAK